MIFLKGNSKTSMLKIRLNSRSDLFHIFTSSSANIPLWYSSGIQKNLIPEVTPIVRRVGDFWGRRYRYDRCRNWYIPFFAGFDFHSLQKRLWAQWPAERNLPSCLHKLGISFWIFTNIQPLLLLKRQRSTGKIMTPVNAKIFFFGSTRRQNILNSRALALTSDPWLLRKRLKQVNTLESVSL